MKLLIVSHKKFFAAGGQYYAKGGTPLEYNTLCEIFDQVHILVNVQGRKPPPPGSQPISKQIKVHSVGNLIFTHPAGAILTLSKVFLQTVLIIKKHKIDLVYGKGPGEIGMAGVFGAKFSGIPGILRLGGDWLSEHSLRNLSKITQNYRKAMLKSASQKSDRVLPVSEEIADKLESLGVDKRKILPPLYSPALSDVFFSTPPLSASQGVKILIFVGTLGRVKNVEGLLRGFKLFIDGQNIEDRVKLGIVGDGPLRPQLESLVVQLKLTDFVTFIGRIPRDEILKYLTSAWALILPSFSEGAPKVVIEAMAAARPVIASAVGEIPNLVEHGVTGYLFDPEDVQDIAEKIKLLLADDMKAVQMGISGREHARQWETRIFRQRISFLASELVNS